MNRVRRAVLATLSIVCWTLAVAVGAFTVGGFAGSGFACQSGHRKACAPNTGMLIAGLAVAVAFGVAGALLWKPKPRDPRRDLPPWEYRD